MFRKKTCVITFLDENEAPRITYSDLEIESCQLTGGSCSCVPRVVLEYNIKRETWVSSKLDRRVVFN